METRTLRIMNPLGMHARASARFVRVASRFVSTIRVQRNDNVMDGKSIMGLLLLAAGHGATITVSADGPDEREAVSALEQLVAQDFEA